MRESIRVIGRALVGVLFLAAIGAAVFPFKTETGVDALGTSTCVPVLEAWKSAPPTPSAADLASFSQGGIPTPEQARGPEYRAIIAAKLKSPAYLSVTRWTDWTLGPGACVPRSRGRIHLSEVLALAGLLTSASLLVDRRLKGSRPPAPQTQPAL
jgi:hypothetical protein